MDVLTKLQERYASVLRDEDRADCFTHAPSILKHHDVLTRQSLEAFEQPGLINAILCLLQSDKVIQGLKKTFQSMSNLHHEIELHFFRT